MQIMKNQKIKMTILAGLLSLSALAGNGVSGGGSGIVLKDGSVKLADTIDLQTLPTEVASRSAIEDMFFKKNRYVKRLASYNNNFFKCTTSKLGKLDLKFKDVWINSLSNIKVLNVEFQLISGASRETLENQSLPFFADSSFRASHLNQVALAVYNKSDLWVQKRFYQRLSIADKCALSVHESLRHLNYNILAETPLETAEIEELTELIMTGNTKVASQIILSHYKDPQSLAQTKELLVEAFAIIETERSSTMIASIAEKLRNVNIQNGQIQESLRKGYEYIDSFKLNELATVNLEAARMIGSILFSNYSILSDAFKSDLRNMHKKFNDLSYDFYTGSAVTVLPSTMNNFSNSLIDRLLINMTMTSKLKFLKRFDVIDFKIVNRI